MRLPWAEIVERLEMFFLDHQRFTVLFQEESGFSGRSSVSEMTRFGMSASDFQTLAHLIHDAVGGGKSVKDEVIALRKRFLELQFCFDRPEHLSGLIKKLHTLL